VLWFGELKATGMLTTTVAVKASDGSKLQLAIGDQKHETVVKDGLANFDPYQIEKTGYMKFELTHLAGEVSEVESSTLDGPAVKASHFNLDPRRNAASVHLAYPTPKDENIAMFYNVVTAVEEPLHTFYMACGFSRGYFGK